MSVFLVGIHAGRADPPASDAFQSVRLVADSGSVSLSAYTKSRTPLPGLVGIDPEATGVWMTPVLVLEPWLTL